MMWKVLHLKLSTVKKASFCCVCPSTFFFRERRNTQKWRKHFGYDHGACVCRHNPRLKGGVVWGQNNIVFSSVLEQCGSDPNRPRKETARLTIDERYQPAAGMKGGAGEICSTCHWSHEKQESRGRSNEMVDEKRRTVRRPSGRMGQVWHLRCQWGSTFFYTIARRVPKQDVSSGTAFSSFLLLWFLFCSSPDYHSNREFPLDFFCVCRVCSLKKISGLPFVAALRRETVLGNENELMIVGCISWTQNAICPSKWTIGCLSKAIESRSLSLPFCTGLQHFIHFIRWNDPAVPKSFKHFRSLTT